MPQFLEEQIQRAMECERSNRHSYFPPLNSKKKSILDSCPDLSWPVLTKALRKMGVYNEEKEQWELDIDDVVVIGKMYTEGWGWVIYFNKMEA